MFVCVCVCGQQIPLTMPANCWPDKAGEEAAHSAEAWHCWIAWCQCKLCCRLLHQRWPTIWWPRHAGLMRSKFYLYLCVCLSVYVCMHVLMCVCVSVAAKAICVACGNVWAWLCSSAIVLLDKQMPFPTSLQLSPPATLRMPLSGIQLETAPCSPWQRISFLFQKQVVKLMEKILCK